MHTRTHHARNNGGSVIKRDLRELRDDLGTIRDDLGTAAHSAMDLGRQMPGLVKDRVQAEIQDLSAIARRQGEQALNGARKQIAARPIACAATLFGAGMMLGWWMHRRR